MERQAGIWINPFTVVVWMTIIYFAAALPHLCPECTHQNKTSNICNCAGMNSTNPKDIQVERSLNIAVTCDEKGEELCNRLCLTLANTTRDDPDGKNRLCKLFGKDDRLKVHVFSKVCDRPYVFTNMISDEMICCKDKHSSPCS